MEHVGGPTVAFLVLSLVSLVLTFAIRPLLAAVIGGRDKQYERDQQAASEGRKVLHVAKDEHEKRLQALEVWRAETAVRVEQQEKANASLREHVDAGFAQVNERLDRLLKLRTGASGGYPAVRPPIRREE